jgi:hypothetical protein
MVAIEDDDEVHVTAELRSCVSPLAKVPIALNCAWIVCGTLTLTGVTWIEFSVADSTTRFAVPLIEPELAVIVTTPGDCPKATPATLTVATFVSNEDQVADVPSVCLVPLLKVPVATNCSGEPGAISPELGLNVMEVNVAVLTFSWADPVADAPA